MLTLHVTRPVRVPDPARLALYRRAPELGPKILFFSGGSALREASRRLIEYTRNSIHLITPFDSGGSSAQLREAFHMLAVGDLRNRLMALADRSFQGNPEVFELFAYRFPHDASQAELRRALSRMVAGQDPSIRAIPDPLRRLVRNHLGFFADAMPREFDLGGANIGNLILAGGFLNQSRHIDPVIYLFSRLVNVRGVVRPVANEYLHLAAELANGETLVGQHRITGKEELPLASPIRRLFLTRRRRDPVAFDLAAREKVLKRIAEADLICFPIGSFYSSLIANLLPRGIAAAIAASHAPKVYVPNLGHDPEMLGLSAAESVEVLLAYLERNLPPDAPRGSLLDFVLIDRRYLAFSPEVFDRLARRGVQVLDLPLVTSPDVPLVDPQELVDVLVSMA